MRECLLSQAAATADRILLTSELATILLKQLLRSVVDLFLCRVNSWSKPLLNFLSMMGLTPLSSMSLLSFFGLSTLL